MNVRGSNHSSIGADLEKCLGAQVIQSQFFVEESRKDAILSKDRRKNALFCPRITKKLQF